MFFDLPEAGERALLVHCETGGKKQSDTAVSNSPAGYRSAEGESVSGSLDGDNPEVEEFVELVKSAGVSPIYLDVSRRKAATSGYFIGTGKVDELAQIIADHNIDVVLFNHQLSPSQERNMEKVFQCRVLDRTGLILDLSLIHI